MKLHNVVSVASILGAILSFNLQQEAKANVADDLNKNYNNIVDNCGSDTSPAYECSGNLVRLTSASTQYHVWDPSPNSINVAKGISFTYLRHDIKVDLRFAGHLSGIIYYPNMQKPSSTDASEVRCAFPTDGFTINGRENGCGATGWSAGSGPCQDQGIYTADAWYTHFMSVTQNSNNQYQHQCSFTMSAGTPNTATIFDEDLKAIRKVFHYENDGLNHASYNELLMKLWPLNAKNIIDNPEKLPIQAFFYMNKDGKSGLADAQYYQQDYYKTAKIIIPIVELNNDDTANISFSYHPQDRGVTIADELNVNYNNIVDNCGSKKKPAYECSGILFRQASYSSSSHVWDPNAKSIQYGGISFSYLRKDIHFKNFLHSNRSSGFIYYPSQQVQSGADSTEVSCAFPVGGKTDYRSYGRCGGSFSYPQASTECQQQNINTAEEWYTHFMSVAGDAGFYHQCGFDVSHCGQDTANAFLQSIKAHNQIYNMQANVSEYGTNEVIVGTQETDANGKSVHPELLPLQAFYYQNATGLTEAQKYQQDYYNTTSKVVPVVYMNTTDLNNISFEYKAADQVVNNN